MANNTNNNPMQTNNINNNTSYSNKSTSNSNKASSANSNTNSRDTITRMHPSMKRPRAPIACYRCHHKKVRCDGVHPNCTRCLSTGVLCAYPSSRRSRNTQPTNVDPFIDNLSQLEARIRRIETDLESQRVLVRTVCANDNTNVMDSNSTSPSNSRSNTNHALTSRMLKTEKDLQESRSIVAQLRLRGEQRAARGRRAAAAAAASVASSTTPGPDKNNTSLSGKSGSKDAGNNTASSNNKQRNNSNNKLRVNSNIKKECNMMKSPYSSTPTPTTNDYSNCATLPSPPFYFTQSDSSSPVDFINPSSNYYFPTYSPNTQQQYTTANHLVGTDHTMTPICGDNNSSNNNVSAPFAMMVGDWPLLNDIPHTTAVHHHSNNNNGFVDPMIIAAAEARQHGIAPPLLSVSSYMAVDEENSIMAARAKSLSHLPPASVVDNMMTIPGLQPSSSSTSTSSNTSTNFGGNYNLYDPASYTSFIGNDNSNNDTLMMMHQQRQQLQSTISMT